MVKTTVNDIHSFVLRGGRISEKRKQLVLDNRGGFCVDVSCLKNLDTRIQPISFKQLFGNDNPIVIEIGFGMGDSPFYFAQKYPEKNLLGIEVHFPGVAKLISLLNETETPLKNIRIIRFDAIAVLKHLVPENSIDAFHIFFPDPWPKKKHHKRRLIKKPFIDLLVSRLKLGGYICTATDWKEYGTEMNMIFESFSNLVPKVEGGFCDRPEFRPITSFEKKGLNKNHQIINLIYIKKE